MTYNEKDGILTGIAYIRDLAKKDPQFATKKFYEIEEKEKNKCKTLMKKIDDINNQIKTTKQRKIKNELSRQKGKLLEDLATTLLNTCNLFKIYRNLRDCTNEIDLLLQPSDYNSITKLILPKFMLKDIIIECKNYDKKIDVDWTGKFYSLIKSHKLTFGILFSFKEFAGTGDWVSSRGLVKKIFLNENIVVINICFNDINYMFEKNLNLVELIKAKYGELEHQTKYKNLITPHPAEI